MQGGARDLVSNTFNMVKRFSGKVAAVYSSYSQAQMQEQAPPPMEMYHPSPRPGVSEIVEGGSKRWRRSPALRMAMLRRRRRERQQGVSVGKVSGIVLTIVLLVLVITASGGGVYGYNYYEGQAGQLQDIANQHIPQETHIYDRNGALLYEVYDQKPQSGGKRTPVTYKDIPWVLQQAMTSAEDPTFWDNTGVDPQAILRAATSSGGGASTITQQLVKGLTGNDQGTLQRKISEASLAIALTQEYSKAKIIEMYFNTVGFDISDLGVEAAFEKYFGMQPACDKKTYVCKPAVANINLDPRTGKSDPYLGLARASLLAGMPQSPNHYDPTLPGQDTVITDKTHKQLALDRQKYVLGRMVVNNVTVDGIGQITPEIAQKVSGMTAKMEFKYKPMSKRAPHFVDWVVIQLQDMLGSEAFLTGGFQIRTTIDINMEDYVERAVTRHLTQRECQQFMNGTSCTPLNTGHNVNDAAVMVMNSHTGEILAMSGSASYNSNNKKEGGNFNAAVTSTNPMELGRQPGSTFKPFVYAAAFEMGWSPGTVLSDTKTFFPNGAPAGTIADKNHLYVPSDYGGEGFYGGGLDTVRKATANSRNIPAVKAMMYAGINNVHNLVQRLGIDSLDRFVTARNLDNARKGNAKQTFDQVFGYGPSIALGSVETPLIQMMGGYQTFANGGMRVLPHSILDIWDNYGRHLYHYDTVHPPAVRALSPQVAYMMTSILTDEPARFDEFGAFGLHTLSFSDIDSRCISQSVCSLQVAAKTGTSDDFKDNWTMGYTPDVVVGVWAGNADSSPMGNGSIGITGAGPIWHSVIERAAGFCPNDINVSDNIPCGNFDLGLHTRVFPVPAGLTKVYTSAKDGLMASSGNYDYVLAGQAPQQSGVNPNPIDPNGNPPGGGNNGGGGGNGGG